MNENHTPVPPEESDESKLLDALQALAENTRLLVLGPIIVAVVALGVSFLLTPKYIAATSLLVPQQQQSMAAAALSQLGAAAGMAGVAAGLKNPADMYVGLLRSRTIADRMIDRFGMMKIKKVKTREDAREILARISGVAFRKDGLITIEVVSPSPQLSAAMANAYVEELSSLTSRLAVTEAQQRRQFLEKEMTKAKDNLVKAEIALGGAGVSESTLKFNPAAMGQGLATLKAQLVAKEVQLSSMRGYLTDNSPNVRQTQQELAALRAQLGKLEHTAPKGDNAEYVSRYREFKYNEVLFEQLARQYEMARIDEAREGAVIQVVDVAVPPERKANLPKAQVAILAALASGFALIMFVLIRHAVRTANKNPETATKLAAIRAGLGRLKPWRRCADGGLARNSLR